MRYHHQLRLSQRDSASKAVRYCKLTDGLQGDARMCSISAHAAADWCPEQGTVQHVSCAPCCMTATDTLLAAGQGVCAHHVMRGQRRRLPTHFDHWNACQPRPFIHFPVVGSTLMKLPTLLEHLRRKSSKKSRQLALLVVASRHIHHKQCTGSPSCSHACWPLLAG